MQVRQQQQRQRQHRKDAEIEASFKRPYRTVAQVREALQQVQQRAGPATAEVMASSGNLALLLRADSDEALEAAALEAGPVLAEMRRVRESLFCIGLHRDPDLTLAVYQASADVALTVRCWSEFLTCALVLSKHVVLRHRHRHAAAAAAAAEWPASLLLFFLIQAPDALEVAVLLRLFRQQGTEVCHLERLLHLAACFDTGNWAGVQRLIPQLASDRQRLILAGAPLQRLRQGVVARLPVAYMQLPIDVAAAALLQPLPPYDDVVCELTSLTYGHADHLSPVISGSCDDGGEFGEDIRVVLFPRKPATTISITSTFTSTSST